MRIVHLANHVKNSGNGIVNMMVDLACSQAKAGHDVAVATSGGDFESLLAAQGVRHFRLRQSPRPWGIPAMLAGFRRLLNECRPDIVHAHMMTGALIGRVGALMPRYGLVTTVHNEFQKSASVMRLGDRVVCVSKEVARSMEKRGVPASKIAVVRNGTVGTPRRAGAGRPPSPELRRPSIVTVAGMYERKGIHDLLRAFAILRDRFPEASLYLVGDGPDRQAMEDLARSLQLDGHAHFAGFVADPRSYLQETDIFVLASHKEPGALVLTEAREAGCAIVATQVDGNPEMLDAGAAGLLVPPGSPEALAAAIGRLLADPGLRAEYQRRSPINLDAFHVDGVCERYLCLYEETLRSVTGRLSAST